MATIRIAVINQSKTVKDKEVSAFIPALQKQVTHDFAPIWGIDAAISFIHSGSKPPANAWQLVILDDADQADALGYHDLTAAGLPLMKIFAATAAADTVSWTSVASHETLEALADPYVDSTVFVQADDTHGRLWPLEVCDPVEGDTYTIGSLEVSNFVTPHWFMPEPPAGAKFDFLDLTHDSFDVRPNGYMDYFDVKTGTGWQQINADLHPGVSS